MSIIGENLLNYFMCEIMCSYREIVHFTVIKTFYRCACFPHHQASSTSKILFISRKLDSFYKISVKERV